MMADPSGFEFWQAGELPLMGVGGADSGSFEFWQAGEQPPAFSAPQAVVAALAAAGASTSAGSLTLTLHQPWAAGASTSAGSLRMRIGRHVAAAGASTSTGALRWTALSPGMALVTQAGLLIDVERTAPVQVTQAGALLDAIRTPPVNVTQAGLLIDAERTPPIQVTQAGLLIDVDSTPLIRVTQAGLMIDARYQRPESLLNCWEFWVEDIVGHHLAYLDGATNKGYLEALSDCGGGTFTISSHDPKATAANLAVGNIVKVRYRNVDIGAWMIENIQEALVGPGESAEQVYVVSGRGLLALLEHGLVYPSDMADAGTAEREFTGVSKAQILLDLYAEFVLRGGGELNMAFGSEYDSSGQAFTDTVVLKFKAGQSLLDVARNLAGLGLELTVDPDNKTLQAWNTAGADRSATIRFRQGQAVMSSRRTTEGIGLTNVVLGEGQGIFVESKDATSIASHRRRESYLPVRNTDDAGQVGVANELLLAGWKEPRSAYTLEVLAGPFYPFFDYHIGDIVAISIPDKLDGDYRILGISINEVGGPCDLRVTLDINDLATEYLHKLQLALDASLMSVRPGPAAASGLASSGTEPLVGAGGTNLGPGAVKSPQVDWGTGPGQVSAEDVPIADAGGFFDGTEVETALQECLTADGSRAGATGQLQTFTTGIQTGPGDTNDYAVMDGGFQYFGGAYIHKAVTIAPSMMIPDPTSPPLLGAVYSVFQTYKFDRSTDRYLHFQVEMPYDWREGSVIRPYVHWAGQVAGTDSNSVGWTLEYSWTNAGGVQAPPGERNVGEIIDAASLGTAYALTTSGVGTDLIQAYEHYTAPFGLVGDYDGIDGAGKTIRSVLLCRLQRRTGMLETYGGDVYLLGFDLTYEVGTNGAKGRELQWGWD